MQNKNKKQIYNESSSDLRTYINGETAIKPYFYYRNGLIHVRYLVDRCYELTKEESEQLKNEISKTNTPDDKQAVLAKVWKNCTDNPDKEFIKDGILELEKKIKQYREDQNK